MRRGGGGWPQRPLLLTPFYEGEAAAWRGGVEWGMRRGGGGVAAASPLTNPHIPTPNQPTPFNLTPHFNRPLEPLSLPPFLPPYPSPPTMIPVQSFTGGAAGHKWGCWSQVGLLVTGGAAGPGVTALVLVPGAGVTALVPVPGAGVTALVPVPGAGVTALVLVHGADGARRVGRTADGLQAGRDLTVGGAQALHSAATPFPLSLSPPQRSAANPFPSSLSHPQRPPLHMRTVAMGGQA
ncbi:unnamed protein product [Closterium sp. Naga37s-1]|nr:unnamed protein product [Closterium sp. Naga37s-1]